ncbi:hypothetical protein M899_1861 [Bacteriovorax sp. BSW11_IV]|uniref:hypothetical protein n=1 Tax=Bacteriovorax sp. BSW11_IV TaxID=1353529 RepID=UPI000389ED2E|nr:hypothetical protein [Bacteriovorax sp. BSW11_IV]EQC48438.1 hypothetical protein M899_1861 [Bacteriovorax sp. BSW11_IV]
MRAELLHPLTVHLPLGLIILIPFALLGICFATKKSKEKTNEALKFSTHALYIIGLFTFAMSTFLGDMAFDEVKKNLCQIGHVYSHEEYAYTTLVIFLVSHLSYIIFEVKHNLLLLYSATVISFAGTYYLIQTGHSGAMLVYEQGAAVKDFKCQN